MLISNLIALEDIIQNEEKEIFYVPKEKCSLHNFPLIFFKTNSPEKPYYCHECINQEYDILINNQKEDNSTHSFIRIDDINKIYQSKMKELIKIRENENNIKNLSEKYNQFGNYVIEFIVKETKKFINQLIIKNCLNEKNDFISDKNIQVRSSITFINSSNKIINDAKSIECKGLSELNSLQNKFINSKDDLIDGIQKVFSKFFGPNIIIKREKKEITFEEDLDCLFSKFENFNGNIKDIQIDFPDKKTDNQSCESNKNSNYSTQFKSNNITNKFNSTLLFPIVKKNPNLIEQRNFDDNKDKDLGFPNTSKITVNNSDSSFSIENTINNCLSRKEEKKEKENSKIIGNEDIVNNIIKNQFDNFNETKSNLNNNHDSRFKNYKTYNNFNVINKKNSNNNNNNNNNDKNNINNNKDNGKNLINDFIHIQCSDCKTPFLITKKEINWRKRCMKCQEFYRNKIYKSSIPVKKYYYQNERKIKVICITCRKAFLCPIHLRGYRLQCLYCFKKSRYYRLNGDLLNESGDSLFNCSNNNNNFNYDAKTISSNNDKFEFGDSLIEEINEKTNIINNNSNDIINTKYFENDNERQKIKNEIKEINLNRTF